MKVLKIAGVSILALGLVLGMVLPVLAASDSATLWADDSQTRIVRGKVLSADEGNPEFVIQSGEEEVAISVDSDTKYFKLCVPGRIIALAQHRVGLRNQNQEEVRASARHQMGLRQQNQEEIRASDQHQARLRLQDRICQLDNVDTLESKRPKLKQLCPFGEEAEFSDIAVDDRVAVWLASGENGYLAERVLIIKPTTYARISGTITDVSSVGKTITIEPADGNEAVTLEYNERTIFTLRGIIQVEPEQSAHAIYDSDNMIAKRVMVGMPPIELTE